MDCPACNQECEYLRDEVVDGVLCELWECEHHGVMSPKKED